MGDGLSTEEVQELKHLLQEQKSRRKPQPADLLTAHNLAYEALRAQTAPDFHPCYGAVSYDHNY